MSTKSILRSPKSEKKNHSVKFFDESPKVKSSSDITCKNDNSKVSDVVLAIQEAKNRIIKHLSGNASQKNSPIKLTIKSVRISSPQISKTERTIFISPFSTNFNIKKNENLEGSNSANNYAKAKPKMFEFDNKYKIYGTSPPKKFNNSRLKCPDLN